MRRALPISRNFLALERSQSALQTSSVVIQQAPFERTTSYGKGAAKGPQAILKASHQVELFDAALGLELVSAIPGIATLPPVAPGNRDGRQYAQALRDGAVRQPIGHQLQDLDLARGEVLDRGLRLARARRDHGAQVGIEHDEAGGGTRCHACGERLIGRDWYTLTAWNLTDDGRCRHCHTPCAGVFDGPPGGWGARRLPVRLAAYSVKSV